MQLLPAAAAAGDSARNTSVKILDEVRGRYGFALVGYVAMPEHIHLLIGEPAKGTPSTVLQVLKQRVSRALRKKRRKRGGAGQLELRFGNTQSALRQFRQRRFHDFNVWSRRKVTEKLNYMHLNPVQRKLVKDPKDWPWSSYAAYAGKGISLVRIDFRE